VIDIMKDKKYPMIYRKSNYAVMANDIIKGKQEMTLQEAKIIRLLITQVAKEDRDLKTYTVNIKELGEFLGISVSNLYRDVFDLCDRLLDRKIKIESKKDNKKEAWVIFHWLQLAQYDGHGQLTLMLSEQVKPYVLELDKWFTKYRYENILAMNSFYAIRLYELLKMTINMSAKSKNDFTQFKIDYLRNYFSCESKFLRISDFKRKVIEIGIREINNRSDLFVSVEYIKTKRTITDVKFYIKNVVIKTKEVKAQKNIEAKQESELEEVVERELIQQQEYLDDLIDTVRLFIKEPLKTKEIKTLLLVANNNVSLIKEKYNIAKQQLHINNLTAWLISAIKNDYAEPVEAKSNKPIITTQKVNRFVNYEQDDWDFDELEKLERERIKRNLEK